MSLNTWIHTEKGDIELPIYNKEGINFARLNIRPDGSYWVCEWTEKGWAATLDPYFMEKWRIQDYLIEMQQTLLKALDKL